jgi:hypothetical protein
MAVIGTIPGLLGQRLRPGNGAPAIRCTAMARHDYDLPADYEQRIEDGTMSEWYTQERAKRQALRQNTNFEREFTGLRDRIERVIAAASETVKIER